MKLVTWNCKGALARKHVALCSLRPDVAVLPEAGKVTALPNVVGSSAVRSMEWVGDNPRKGLAVVSYGDYRLKVHDSYDPSLRWILPLTVDGPMSFVLFAVWTVPHRETRYYVQCLFEAIEKYRSLLKLPYVVWAGDFNNNVAFDHRDDELSFANWLAKARVLGFESLYHLQNRCEHGAESHNTFFLHHNARKGHHLDFIFAKPALYSTGAVVSVENPRQWLEKSDHVPVACLFRGRDEE